ncbi:MAG: hypothetical protein LBJ90_07455, partial [Treponema sp.]|nr:hypothetical protein [Treponema sp.]
MARKRTFLLNHELIDGIRFLDGETFKAVICGIADLDEYKEPETKNTVALAFIGMEKGFVLENAEKWAGKCERAGNAREKRAELKSQNDQAHGSEINSEIRTENSDSSSVPVTVPVPEETNLHHFEKNRDSPNFQSFPTAEAVDQGEPTTVLVPASQGPPPALKTSRKLELTAEQLQLFHAAKVCFESSDKAKALMYQDKGSTAMEMRNLKTLVIRCSNMAPGITA